MSSRSDEIEGAKIGDNDNLSALVTNLVDADLLVLLTDTGGLYTADPNQDAGAKLIDRVERIDAEIEALAGGAQSGVGVGGMSTKVQAAKLATGGGADMYIAGGREPDVLTRLAAGEQVGTYFPASADRTQSRRRWMLAGLSVKGSVVVDDGAARALREKKTSLLPAGVREVQGAFQRGDAVNVVDEAGARIACGIANYAADEVAAHPWRPLGQDRGGAGAPLRQRGRAPGQSCAAVGLEYGHCELVEAQSARGESDRARIEFLVDTGSFYTAVTPSVRAQLGLLARSSDTESARRRPRLSIPRSRSPLSRSATAAAVVPVEVDEVPRSVARGERA